MADPSNTSCGTHVCLPFRKLPTLPLYIDGQHTICMIVIAIESHYFIPCQSKILCILMQCKLSAMTLDALWFRAVQRGVPLNRILGRALSNHPSGYPPTCSTHTGAHYAMSLRIPAISNIFLISTCGLFSMSVKTEQQNTVPLD